MMAKFSQREGAKPRCFAFSRDFLRMLFGLQCDRAFGCGTSLTAPTSMHARWPNGAGTTDIVRPHLNRANRRFWTITGSVSRFLANIGVAESLTSSTTQE